MIFYHKFDIEQKGMNIYYSYEAVFQSVYLPWK